MMAMKIPLKLIPATFVVVVPFRSFVLLMMMMIYDDDVMMMIIII